MPSTDLVARFPTKARLVEFENLLVLDPDGPFGLIKADYVWQTIGVVRDYPQQITLHAVHPVGVDLAALVVERGGQVISLVTADTP